MEKSVRKKEKVERLKDFRLQNTENREEWETLYWQYVCPQASVMSVSLLRLEELKRLVCQGVYFLFRHRVGLNIAQIINHLHSQTGKSKTTLYRWTGDRNPEFSDYLDTLPSTFKH